MGNKMPSRVQLVFDTNILVDALLARGSYFQYGVTLLEQVRDGLVEGWVASRCLTTVYYILERQLAGETHNRKESHRMARALLDEIMGFLKPLPQTGTEFMALDADAGDDLEDQLIVTLSKRYLKNPLIVTRDKWFLKINASAAHPKEVIDNDLHLDLPDPGDIPFIDLHAQQRVLQPELQDKIQTVLCHGKYIMGPEVAELETRLAEYVGVNHCITCSSGTDALLMALMAKGVGPGDAILTTPFTFFATAEVIALLGATPVFVDIDPRTFNMDPEKLAVAIQTFKSTSLTSDIRRPTSGLTPKGIVTVDLFGQPCDYHRINGIARENRSVCHRRCRPEHGGAI
ncbi:MAG: aminotransferase class I/II-fold pyridoxal phosphate-dependent enzyme [Deltaproteobacteria bacterium]|nr:aminotransferase class I/II-fold pyridoxal phosphate-dependent enzyme [Deltaproteobacteria bacterium]